MKLRSIIAVCATLVATAVSAQTYFGPPLLITNINAQANGDAEFLLRLDDYRNIVGFKVFGKADLNDPTWTPLNSTHANGGLFRGGTSGVWDFAQPEASLFKSAGFNFFKAYAVKGTVEQGSDGDYYAEAGKDTDDRIIYIKVGPDGLPKFPPTYWVKGSGNTYTRIRQDGDENWKESGCLCGGDCGCGIKVEPGTGGWYVSVTTNNIGEVIYIKTDKDGRPIYPPTFWKNKDGTPPIRVWPSDTDPSGWTETDPGTCTCENCNCGGDFPYGFYEMLPPGTILIPGKNNRPPAKDPGTGYYIVKPGDVILTPPDGDPFLVGQPGGIYDPTIPAVVNDSPKVVTFVPSGTTVYGEDPNAYVVVPGPDGKIGTSDDVKIAPAGTNDVDHATGIVTVPVGSVISTNGVPLILDIDGTTYGPTYPEGTLVLPDGTIIIPGVGNYPWSPTINPDGTVTVGRDDIIVIPPYDTYIKVPNPGGKYDPRIVPPVIKTIPGGIVIPLTPVPVGPGGPGGKTVASIALSGGAATCNKNDDCLGYDVLITYSDSTTSTDKSLVTWDIAGKTSANTKVLGAPGYRVQVGSDETATFITVTASIGSVTSSGKNIVVGGSQEGGVGTPIGIVGRELTPDVDTSKWYEVAVMEVNGEMYSLIIRKDVLGIGTRPFHATSPIYSNSSLKQDIDNWFNGMKSGSSILYRKAMTTDAVSKHGVHPTSVQDAHAFADGFSSPLNDMAKDKPGNDSWMGVAFPLSFQEHVNFCSMLFGVITGASPAPTFPSALIPAQENWNRLTPTASWCRSPTLFSGAGNGATAISYFSNGRVDVGIVNNGSSFHVRPALWVKSDIFNQ